MKPSTIKSKDKQRAANFKSKGENLEKEKKEKILKGDGGSSRLEKKQAPKQEEKAEENICDQETPELLQLSDISEISVRLEMSAEDTHLDKSQKSNAPSKAPTKKSKLSRKKTKVAEKQMDDAKSSTEAAAKKAKPRRLRESNIPRPASAERKKQHADIKTETSENVLDTSDRLKEWLSNLNTESSKDSLAVHNNFSNPIESSGTTPTKPSFVSSVNTQPVKPLPVKEAETQTNVDLEERREKLLMMEKNAKLRHDQFLQRYRHLVEMQFLHTTRIWRLSKELQSLSLEDFKNRSDTMSQISTGLDDTGDRLNDTMFGDPGSSTNQTCEDFRDVRNVTFDAHSWPDSRPNPNALVWLEHELLHCEALECESSDVPPQLLNHVPCLYGKGFLQRRELKPAPTRVAFLDDWSTDGKISIPKGKSLKKRLQIFKNSIKVRKESPRRRAKKGRHVKTATLPQQSNSVQYYILFLLVLTQFCIQLNNM